MTETRRILVLFAHPAVSRSRVNRRLVASVRELAGVTVHDLYEVYPEFDIDAVREQALLTDHDVVVLQHPLYWYSTPAILKQWFDLVLEHGWAYGDGGTALRGKILVNAVTAGGREASYRREGSNRFTVRELLAPIEQTARLCGMAWLPPFVVFGTHSLADPDVDAQAARYRRMVAALRDGALEEASVRGLDTLEGVFDGSSVGE